MKCRAFPWVSVGAQDISYEGTRRFYFICYPTMQVRVRMRLGWIVGQVDCVGLWVDFFNLFTWRDRTMTFHRV